jgi:carbon-monoxide dehydrogenase large subunit
MSTKLFGTPVPRRADDRLVKGEGRYLDDLVLPKMLHVAFLRSTHPSAALRSVDAARARALPGVAGIFVDTDLGAAGQPFPQLLPHHGLASATWSALARGRVNFVGEAIAVVAAESIAAATEAVEAIEVDYAAEDPVLDLEAAVRPGTRQIHPDAPRNIAMHLVETCGDAEAALRAAPHRLKERFRITRGGGMPLEPRGILADYDTMRRELTIWSSTQEPHTVRNIVAALVGLPRHQVRVIAPDTGGGFGTKLNVYPEEVVIPWLALRLGRPVKWVETRSEHMLSATQEREQIHDIEVGFDAEGRLLALKNSFYHDMGAYAPRGGAVPHNTSAALIGPYRIANVSSEIFAVYTNTVTVSAYRGAGQPQGVFVIERTMDRIAAELGRDPADVRRVNTLTSDAFPYDTGLTNLLGGAVEYESGDFIGTLDKGLEAAGYAALRAKQAEARKAGRHFGIGIANYVELTGRGPWEGSGVRVEPDGSVTVYTGAPSQGQGHETTLAQVCADHLGIGIEKIRVLAGDTALIPHGIGTFASRVGVLAGNAVRLSSIQVKDKILRIASDLLEVGAADLEVEDGRVFITGVPDKGMTFAELQRHAQRAARGDDEEPGLEAVRYFKTSNITYSNGTHIVSVEVDVDTGMVEILSYALAHDCGRLINPLIVEGQIWGGIACGIGNSLLEEHTYNADGQLMSGSFMDYAMPLAIHMPDVTMVHQETPSTLNPLGVKGVGEAGTIPVPAAICNAVEDALRPLGVKINVAPLPPSRLWKLIQEGRGVSPA